MKQTTAHGEWLRLSGLRKGFLNRCERYANFTLPRLCLPSAYKQDTHELSTEFQAVGAQAVNHIVNKLMLALFAPSRPFIRLAVKPSMRQKLISQNITDAEIDSTLAQGEQTAVRQMDRDGTIRPKLYQVLTNLVVLGNTVLFLPESERQEMRVFGIKNFVVRRTASGKVKTLIIREELAFDELEAEVQTLLDKHYNAESRVEFYQWIDRNRDGSYSMSQWVGVHRLPQRFDGKWPEDKLPYRVLTWNLSDEDDYGTGLVEDFAGDFTALSALSKAEVQGALLASEFRWLVNPAGFTKAEDLEESENGAALPGVKDDISLLANSKPGDLQVVGAAAEKYIRRIGQGFLLNSAVTRSAERVTAEEIRQQAVELETSHGGTYSRIAVDLQRPFGFWLLREVKLSVDNTQIDVTIITGLDALSRNADLENVRQFMADIALIGQLPEAVLATVKLDNLISTLALGRNLAPDKYVKNAQERADDQAAQQEADATAAATQAGTDIAVTQAQQGNQ